LAHPAFLAGELDTHFLERHAGELAARSPGLDRVRVAAIGATLHGIAERRGAGELAPPGWRNVRFADQQVTYQLGSADVIVAYRPLASAGEAGSQTGIELAIGGKPTRVSRFGVDGDRVWFVEHAGHRRVVRACRAGAEIWVLSEGQLV